MDDMIVIEKRLFDDLCAVAEWYQTACNSLIAGETLDMHGDPGAFLYLKEEGQNILERATSIARSHSALHAEAEVTALRARLAELEAQRAAFITIPVDGQVYLCDPVPVATTGRL